MSAPHRRYIETHCSGCARPMVLRVSVDCDGDDVAALARCIICPVCHLARTAPARLIEARGTCGRVIHRDCPDAA